MMANSVVSAPSERHPDELGDDVVRGGETGSRLVEREDERSGDEDVGQRGKAEPQDDHTWNFWNSLKKRTISTPTVVPIALRSEMSAPTLMKAGMILECIELVDTPSEEELVEKAMIPVMTGSAAKARLLLVAYVRLPKLETRYWYIKN